MSNATRDSRNLVQSGGGTTTGQCNHTTDELGPCEQNAACGYFLGECFFAGDGGELWRCVCASGCRRYCAPFNSELPDSGTD